MRGSRRHFVRSVAGASLLSLADRAAARNSIPLAVPGKAPYSIFLSPQASPSERWAAEELRRHVEQMTGIALRIDTSAGITASTRAIAIGRSALTERIGVEAPEGELCTLKTVGETVVIAGGRRRGTMYGVSILLEKLGCRWFTADVERIPKLGAVWLPEMDELHSPGFGYREVFFTEAQGKEWSARNRLNGNFHKLDESVGGRIEYLPWAHSYYDLAPPDRYYAAHPEYFALVDGRRRREGAQLCLTNAELLRLTVEQVRGWLDGRPEISVASVSQNDTAGWCECGPCRQAIKEEGGAISGLALRFVNQVAEQVGVSHPGKTIDMLAYQDTFDPPSTARPRANVQIRLCPIDACQAHSFRTCAFNRRFRDRLEKWSQIAPNLLLWQYSINFSHYLAPFPNYDELMTDIPLFWRHGVSGMFVQGAVSEGGGGDDAELRSYLAARLLWAPNLDAAAEIRGFMDAVYGPAAQALHSYFELRQQEVRRGQHLFIDQNPDARYLTPEFLIRGRALLEQALPKTATVEARRRVERHLLSVQYVETIRAQRCVVQGESFGPVDPAYLKDATQKLVSGSAALGITNLREGYPIAQQVADWGDPSARYRAVVLKAGSIQATVIPELGRVIALGSPNVLRVPDPGEWGYPHKGGIYVSLTDGGPAGYRLIDWRLASAAEDRVTLTGGEGMVSMEIAISKGTLHLRVIVANSGNAPVSMAILCRAELACGPREATLLLKDSLGKQQHIKLISGETVDGSLRLDVGQREWALQSAHPSLRVANRFHIEAPMEHAPNCDLRWSFRGGDGLNVTMSAASPLIELAPGQPFTLTSDYDLS